MLSKQPTTHTCVFAFALIVATFTANAFAHPQIPVGPSSSRTRQDRIEEAKPESDIPQDNQTPEGDTPQTAVNPLAPPPITQQDGGLPRRVKIGLSFSESADGLVVEAVAPRSASATAGLVEGDVIQTVDDAPAKSQNVLLWRLRKARAGEPIRFTVVRAGEPVEIVVYAEEVTREGDLDSNVEYGAFRGVQGRLRSILCLPKRGISTPRPAILIIRGIGQTASDAPGNNVYRELAFALGRSGVVSLRYDPEGLGDSEGPENYSVDFNSEVADAKAALDFLRADPRIDQSQVFVLGVGTGGGVAAAVAASANDLKGLIVVGTIARPLLEYVVDSRRQQLLLAGFSPGEVDDLLRRNIAVFAQLTLGGKVQPDSLGIVARDLTVFGKNPEFWRQYDSVNYARLFTELKIPVLNAIGEYDFISTLNDHRVIADALRARGDQDQVLVILDRADHDLRLFDSREAAFNDMSSPDVPVNDRALNSIVDWVQGQKTRARQIEPAAASTPEPDPSATEGTTPDGN